VPAGKARRQKVTSGIPNLRKKSRKEYSLSTSLKKTTSTSCERGGKGALNCFLPMNRGMKEGKTLPRQKGVKPCQNRGTRKIG